MLFSSNRKLFQKLHYDLQRLREKGKIHSNT